MLLPTTCFRNGDPCSRRAPRSGPPRCRRGQKSRSAGRNCPRCRTSAAERGRSALRRRGAPRRCTSRRAARLGCTSRRAHSPRCGGVAGDPRGAAQVWRPGFGGGWGRTRQQKKRATASQKPRKRTNGAAPMPHATGGTSAARASSTTRGSAPSAPSCTAKCTANESVRSPNDVVLRMSVMTVPAPASLSDTTASCSPCAMEVATTRPERSATDIRVTANTPSVV